MAGQLERDVRKYGEGGVVTLPEWGCGGIRAIGLLSVGSVKLPNPYKLILNHLAPGRNQWRAAVKR
jgi:hypothetical protein